MEELQLRKIIHVDMDAFFASVEQRDNPYYRGKPIAVGGSPNSRGVVCAASYEAREFGIHSAMPSRSAYQRCRNLIFVKPRFEVYKQVSNEIREIFFQYTDLVEPLSLDEAYLDVTENKKGAPSATLIAKEIKEVIFEKTKLTASCGISINKFLAKVASDMRKPNGMYLIPPDKVSQFIDGLEIEKFYGVGKVTAAKMRKLGIKNGADLKEWDLASLVGHFGKSGKYFYNVSRGVDNRKVVNDRKRKSIGAERSYARDLEDMEEIYSNLDEVIKILLKRIATNGESGRTLTLKVKYADYSQVTRSKTFLSPQDDFEKIKQEARLLLDTTEVDKKRVRLLGLAVSNLDSGSEIDSDDEVRQLTFDFV